MNYNREENRAPPLVEFYWRFDQLAKEFSDSGVSDAIASYVAHCQAKIAEYFDSLVCGLCEPDLLQVHGRMKVNANTCLAVHKLCQHEAILVSNSRRGAPVFAPLHI